MVADDEVTTRCDDVSSFCGALDRAASVLAATVRERGLDHPETLELILQLTALARVGDGYERDGSFVGCGEAVASSCARSVLRAMASLAEALRVADEQFDRSARDGT